VSNFLEYFLNFKWIKNESQLKGFWISFESILNKYISPEIAVFGIVTALSIATFASTIVISYNSIYMEAAKIRQTVYTTFNSELVCFQSKSTCLDAFDTSSGAARACHRVQ
jgi:hypothetical protein